MFRTSQKHLWIRHSYGDGFHPYRDIIISSVQSHRPIVLTSCRYKSANLNARNYYELLGVERTATQKQIKQAFFKLSKEYHPDSNAADKSLHNKFVKINEAFGILNKQSTRTMYDQSLNSISRSPYQSYSRQPSSSDWSNVNFGSRSAYERRSHTYESNWGTPHYNQTFNDMFRRRMENDRQRTSSYSHYYHSSSSSQQNYFGAMSVILIIAGFGMFIHALQWRMANFSNSQYAMDPKTRHYYAYREWQRLSAIKEAEYSAVKRDSSSATIEEE